MEYDNTQASRNLSLTPAQKRKLGDTDFEIADSEDEDYGWDEDPDAIPPMPSQWQGSEDILLTRQPESDEEQADECDEEESVQDGETEGLESGDEEQPVVDDAERRGDVS